MFFVPTIHSSIDVHVFYEEILVDRMYSCDKETENNIHTSSWSLSMCDTEREGVKIFIPNTS